jgi:G:T-mismatch repair DNA endonuclease (very short patch repair protein)
MAMISKRDTYFCVIDTRSTRATGGKNADTLLLRQAGRLGRRYKMHNKTHPDPPTQLVKNDDTNNFRQHILCFWRWHACAEASRTPERAGEEEEETESTKKKIKKAARKMMQTQPNWSILLVNYVRNYKRQSSSPPCIMLHNRSSYLQ